MQSRRLGCLSGMGILSMLVTVMAISGVAFARGELMYNPGPLNARSGAMLGGVTSHAETGDRCEACHSAPWDSVTMADRCVNCHGEIALQMGNMVALHGAMYQKEPKLECRACHPEHNGPDAPLTNLRGRDFPHELLGFSLNGHRLTAQKEPFTCEDCHHADLSTFATNACDDCHRQMDPVFAQAHLLSFGGACLDCHDGVDRFGAGFRHNGFSFKLTGKHQEVACVQCHVDARKLADFQTAPQDCFSCHRNDDPHETRFGNDCGGCHSTDGWGGAKFDHNQFVGLSTQCVACHADPDFHLGVLGTNCLDCHSTAAWTPAQFNLSHPEPRVEEGGNGINHGGATCRTCHPSTVREYTCLACHSNNQGGEGGEGGDN